MENNFKIKDKIKFKLGNEFLDGIITSFSPNKRIVRIRIIKHGRRCWHEWLKFKDLEIEERRNS